MIYEQNDFCTFLQREAEGQDFQLYPGELGKRIYNEISKEAWAQWQHKQTMLINEKTQHDECRAPQAAGAGDGQLPVRG